MDFKLFLCVLLLLLNCAICGHGRSINPRQAEFQAAPAVPETVNINEPEPNVDAGQNMEEEAARRQQLVTERVPETIEQAEIAKTMIPDTSERIEPVTQTVPETVERSEVLTTRVPKYVTRIEPVTKTYTEIIEHPEVYTTMVPEIITHSEPEFEIVTEIIEHPEIMTTMIPETISRKVPLTTVITELVDENVEPQTESVKNVVAERVEPQTPYVVPQTSYVSSPQVAVGSNAVGPDATLDEIERNNKLRVAKLVDSYIAQLEASARLQIQAQQNIANAQKGVVAPAYIAPAIAGPTYPYVAPVATPASYSTLQDQINANIAKAKATAEANRQTVLANIAKIQEENYARLSALHAKLGLPAPIAPASPLAVASPALPQTSSVVEDPCVHTANIDAHDSRPVVAGTYSGQETALQRLKRQIENNQKKIAADVKARQDKLKADIERLKQKNNESLQKLLHPITVRPTVQLPVTQPPTVFGAPVTKTSESLPTETQPIQDFQQKVNSQIAVDNARAQLPVVTPQTVNPTVILPTSTQLPTLEQLQQKLKEQMQENQRKFEQTLEENRLRLERQQEETKARLASLLPAQPTVIAPLNPIIQTTELPITHQPVATFETTPQTFAHNLESQVEEQNLKTLSNADRLLEDTHESQPSQ